MKNNFLFLGSSNKFKDSLGNTYILEKPKGKDFFSIWCKGPDNRFKVGICFRPDDDLIYKHNRNPEEDSPYIKYIAAWGTIRYINRYSIFISGLNKLGYIERGRLTSTVDDGEETFLWSYRRYGDYADQIHIMPLDEMEFRITNIDKYGFTILRTDGNGKEVDFNYLALLE